MGAIPDVELRTVQGTGEQRPAEPAFGKPGVAVGAVVVDRMEHPGYATYRDAMRTKLWKGTELPVLQVG